MHPLPLSGEIEAIARDLRADPYSHTFLNRAAAKIDQIGRRLHGLGYVRDREIAACLTEAYEQLSASQEVPQVERGVRVQRAIAQMEGALAHLREGGRAP